MQLGSRHHGFTIVELITVITVAGILGVFTFSFFTNLTGTYTAMKKQTDLYQETAYAVERISRELRDAQPGVVAGPPLSFQLSHVTPADRPGDVNNKKYVKYYVNANRLYRVSGTDSPPDPSGGVLIAENVSTFSVTTSTVPPASPTHTVSLTLARGGQTVSFSAMICPKNYSPLTDGACIFTERDFGGCYEDKVF